MNRADIQLLYQYNTWANKRILNAAAAVTEEQFLAPATFPHGGLRGTLTHILYAEWLWRHRWDGASPTERIKPEDFPSFEALRARWEYEGNRLLDSVEHITDEALRAAIHYRTTRGEPKQNILWQAMTHVVNHGTQHRGEAAALLTDFGHSPGDIDLIVYLREQK